MSELLSLAGIIISAILIVIFAYRGFSILIISILMTGLVALLSGENLERMLLDAYMSGFIGFAKDNYFIFLFSALFGKFMADSGAAASIAGHIARFAKNNSSHTALWAVLSLSLISAILTYGGVSLFVVVFCLAPIAYDLFKELDIPWHLFVLHSFGASTFTMGMLPGSPAVHNLMPIKYFGTTAMAAPRLGLICAMITILLGIAYTKWAVRSSQRKGESFFPTGASMDQAAESYGTQNKSQPLWKSLLPLTVAPLAMNVAGLSPVISLICAILSCYLLFQNNFNSIKHTLNQGAADSIIPIITVCATVGLGKVFASVAGFGLISQGLSAIPGPPEIQLAVSVNTISAITGSGAGGMGLSLEILGSRFLEMNIHPEIAHRLIAMSTFMACLPHNGYIISIMTISRLTHRQGYRHSFWAGLVIPLIALILALILVQLGVK